VGYAAPELTVAVRTGDTAAAERAAMLKKPPDFLITTPESLYLLLTADRPREMLRSATTVIVDEIHAVAGNKRGSHLALTLERLVQEHPRRVAVAEKDLASADAACEEARAMLKMTSLDVEKAVATIIEGHAVHVDVGEVNGRIFLNNSSLGLYPSIVHKREQKQKLGQGKWPAFVWATFGVMRRYPFLDVRLNADGKQFSSRTPFVFIGNNEYEMESFDIGGRSRLDAGRLSLYFSHRTGRLGLLGLGVRALLRRLHQAEDFVRLTTTEVLIETKRSRVRVSTDGEVNMIRPPLRYRTLPGALRVIVPKPATLK